MNRPAFLLLVSGIVGMIGAATSTQGAPPNGTAIDPRLTEVDASRARIWSLKARPGFATQLVLPADEIVEHVALGESRGWDVAVHENALLLKPLDKAQATNLFVVARQGGELRRYQFDLLLAGPGDVAPYAMRLFRSESEQTKAVADAKIAAERAEQEAVAELLEDAPFKGPRNYAYSAQGALALQPSEISDNGVFTVLRFPAQQRLPSPYEVGPDGSEQLIAFHVHKDFLILHGVARELRLRQGASLLCLYNEAFSPYGAATATGAASPYVLRQNKAGVGP